MKATGIVCRIYDFGRVVIPKEIRRTMRIRAVERLRDSPEVCGKTMGSCGRKGNLWKMQRQFRARIG